MNKDLKLKIGSTIYDRIISARMPEHERRTALHALQTANDVVGAFTWISHKLEHAAARAFFRPSLKH